MKMIIAAFALVMGFATSLSLETFMITPRGFIDHVIWRGFGQPTPQSPPSGFIIVETSALAYRVKIDIEMGFRDVDPSYDGGGD